MLKEYITDLKNYNFYEDFKKGLYIDALNEHKWKVAQIKDISKYGLRTSIDVHFDGYGLRYDQKYDLPCSHKLAPFRTHTLPYTGPTYDLKRQQNNQKQPTLLMKEFLKGATQKDDRSKAFWINQFIRGQLFIYVDHLVSRRSYDSSRDCEEAVNFILAYIKQGSKILNESLEYLKELEKEPSYDTNLTNVHPKIALIHANIEYLFILNTLIGNKDNRAEIYKLFDSYSVTPAFDLQKRIKQLIIQCKIVPACNRLVEFKSANGRGLPWSIKKQVVLLLNFVSADGYPLPIPSDNREYIQLLDYMGYFTTKGLLTREQEQKKTLQLIVSLIISGNFEGRLRGLNEIKRLLDFRLMDYPGSRKKQLLNSQINGKDLLNFLIDNKNFNPQIFKRSMIIFEYCYRNNMLTPEHLKKILTLHRDKHQLQIKGFYSSLAEFASFLDSKATVSFFHLMVKTLPQDEHLITLAKQYTMTAITKNVMFKTGYSKEGEQLAIGYYWTQITSQSNDISISHRYKTIECFAVLLCDTYYSKQIDKYISLSIKSIANRKNLEFYFKIIHETLKLSKGTRIAKSIEAIEKEVNIVDCVISGLQSTQHQKTSQKMWEGMFEFLEEVTFVSRKKFTYPQARQFWKIKECHKYFLKFLRKYRLKDQDDKSRQKIVNKQLSLDTIKEMLEKIFLDPKQMDDFQNVSTDLYQTVDELLMAYNHNTYLNSGIFQYNFKHTIRVRIPDKVFGLDFYLNILNNSKNKDTAQKAGRRFIQICLRGPQGSKSLQSIKLNNWNFILQKLSKLKRNVLAAYRILLQQLNGRMKSLNILQPDLVPLLVKNKSTGVSRMMHVPRCSSLWKLRHLVAEEFKIEGLAFEMQTYSPTGFKDTTFEKEEDYSVALIASNKEGPCVNITLTKNRHPHLDTLDVFYKNFAESRGEQLLELLNREEGNQALKILDKLPFIKKLQQKITKLSFKDMNQILDSNSLHKLIYQLKILNSFKDLKLITAMLQKGFVDHIAKIILLKRTSLSPQSYNICTTLLTLLTQMIKFTKVLKNPVLFNESFLLDLINYQQGTPCPEYEQYLVKCLNLYRDIANDDSYRKKINKLFETKTIDKTIEAVLFSTTKDRIADTLLQIVNKTKTQLYLLTQLSRLLRIDILRQKQLKCKHLFDLLSLLIERKMTQSLSEPIKALFKAIRKAEIIEQSEETENTLLTGVMNLLLKINRSFPTQIELWINEKVESFVNHIINDCLFSSEPHKLRFKSPGLRALGFKFLEEFAGGLGGRSMCNAVAKTMKSSFSWRKPDEWNISVVKQVSHKYTGLKNLAATCYINSLLQQLFFIDNFSTQIINLEANKIEDKQNIALELQNIFGHLKFSQSPVYTTDSLCKAFILDGQPIDPRIQTDVDQFFHSLMDKLERNLNKIGKKDIINNIFGGQLSNLIIGSQCEHTSERIQPFLSIRLEIKDKKSLEEALKEFIKGEVLQGDNAYFCQKCDNKVKAVKRVCLKTLPQILIVTLKRFQFDFETMQKLKLNSYCSFPELVNVLPYTRDGIDNDHDVDTRLYEYRLKGVVIHYGISEAGHYTSYVQTETQGWQYFDDEKITEFNSKQLGAECFGGIEENPFGDDEQKKKNAYLLFYQKVAKSAPLATTQLKDSAIFKQINEQNMRNKLMNLLFESNMQNFMLQVCSKIDPKTFLIYFYLVFLRNAKKKERIELFYNAVENLLDSKQIAAWQLNQVNDNFLSEFVFYAEYEIRYIVTGLLLTAIKNASPEIIQPMLDTLIYYIGKRNMYPICKVIASASKIRPLDKYLKQIGLPEYVYQLIRISRQPKIKLNIEIKPRKTENDLGSVHTVYAERQLLDPIDLLQTLESFKITINVEDLQALIKRAKKSRTQLSLAYIVARRFADMDNFAKIDPLLEQSLRKIEYLQDEHIFQFFILLVEQLAKITDQFTAKRIDRLVTIYLLAMHDSLIGYRAELLLLLGLFRISSSSPVFRDRVSEYFEDKQGKKLLKQLKSWVKEIASSNLSTSIKFDRLNYWRKNRYNMSSQVLSQLIDSEDKIDADKFLSSLNSVLAKHDVLYTNGQDKLLLPGDYVKHKNNYKVIRCYGLHAELQTPDKRITVPLEDLQRMDYFC